MTLANVRDWLKPQISGHESCTIGKLDTSKSKAVCVYNRPLSDTPISVGGVANSSYSTKKICVLVHWGTNCDKAEQKAQEIYNLFRGISSEINGKKCFFTMEQVEPVGVGTDDKGIYEFTIDLTITYER